MNILEILYILDGAIFLYIMIFLIFLVIGHKQELKSDSLQLLPKEDFCTCSGAQYNNSEADSSQSNCYKNHIPSDIWKQSHAGCVSIDDPAKRALAYEKGDQLPEFSGV